jgi:hypothetical protein
MACMKYLNVWHTLKFILEHISVLAKQKLEEIKLLI